MPSVGPATASLARPVTSSVVALAPPPFGLANPTAREDAQETPRVDDSPMRRDNKLGKTFNTVNAQGGAHLSRAVWFVF